MMADPTVSTVAWATGPSPMTWVRVSDPEGMTERAWPRGPGPEGLAPMTWLRVPGPEGLVKRVRAGARGPEPEGLSQRDWARGTGPGGKDGCTDVETYERTNKYPLHSTGHRPLGAAAHENSRLKASNGQQFPCPALLSP